jgi:phosphate-selective porin OprO/OprP
VTAARPTIFLLVSTVLIVAPMAHGQEPGDTAGAARLERMQQQLDSMKAAQARHVVVTAGPGGFVIRSADNAFALRFRALVQGDARFFLGDSARPGAGGFLLRRVRPSVEATVARMYSLRLVPDFAGNVLALQDGYIEGQFSAGVQVRVGKFKAPFGLERLGSASDYLFPERGFPSGVAPNRDIGFQVSGDLGIVNYALGIFNGVADGGSADSDLNDDKDVVGRVLLQPFRGDPRHGLAGLGLGLAGSYGNQEGSAATPALATYRTSAQQPFFAYRTGVFADGRRTRIGPQARLIGGRYGVLGEYYRSRQRVTLPGTSESISVTAWQVSAALVLFGGRLSPARVMTPATNFDPRAGTWGAVELAGRYGVVEIDGAAFPAFADPSSQAREARGFGLGLNWYLNSSVRMSASYEATTFEGGAAAGDRETEKVLFTRMQLAY